MMGGGFGGCTINLFAELPSDGQMQTLIDCYKKKYGITPEIIQVHPAGGIQISFL
jgi:galactokinase